MSDPGVEGGTSLQVRPLTVSAGASITVNITGTVGNKTGDKDEPQLVTLNEAWIKDGAQFDGIDVEFSISKV